MKPSTRILAVGGLFALAIAWGQDVALAQNRFNNANQFNNWCDPDAPGGLRQIPLSAEDPSGRPMRNRYVKFGVAKSNYSAPWPDVWLRRDDHGVLSCANLALNGTKKAPTGKAYGGGKLV